MTAFAKMFSSKNRNNAIIFVIAFASLLRFWGIWHGYPYSYYPDEQHFINRSLSFGSGDLNPHWFHKPGFLMYILFFHYGIFFVLGWIVNFFPDVDSFATYYFQNPWSFIIIGRVIVTLFGIGTVYTVYRIGKKYWSEKVGVYSALFLSLCYGHVFSGQDVKADIPTAFFTMISIYFFLGISHKETRIKNYIFAGLFAGLGTATKYYSIILLPCVFIASCYEAIRTKKVLPLGKFLCSLAIFWVAYFVVSPYNFLDPLGRRATFKDIVRVFNKVSPHKIEVFKELDGTIDLHGLKEITTYESFINYLEVLLQPEGVGMILGILFLLSVLYLISYKVNFAKISLLSFPILFACVAIWINPSYTQSRHQLVIYPSLAIASGIFLHDMLKRMKYRLSAVVPIFLILLIPLVTVVKNNFFVSRTDTRTLAKWWIEENIPSGSKILLDEYSPVLTNSKEVLEKYYQQAKEMEHGQFTAHLEKYYRYQIQASSALSGTTYQIKEIRHMWWRKKEISEGEGEAKTEYDIDMANPIRKVGIYTFDHYKNEGHQYVITSEDAYDAYIKPGGKKGINFPSYKRFYVDLFQKAKLIKIFDNEEINSPGPTVKVFQIP